MSLTVEEKGKKILEVCLASTSIRPIALFEELAGTDFVAMHGPEHHILDGAVLLTVYHNAGGNIDLPSALEELMKRGLQMPGASCGKWGVCGAVSSLGAALSIIDGTGPISTDESWGKHMRFTSAALLKLAEVGGPRCCKRDAYLAFTEAVKYLNANKPVSLEQEDIVCHHSPRNAQCLGARCPFHR